MKIYFLWSDDIVELWYSTLWEMPFCVKRKNQILILLENPFKKRLYCLRSEWARWCVSSFRGHMLYMLTPGLHYGGGQASPPITTGTGKQNRFRANWGFKISVAFGAVSDAWDKSKLYYQKTVAFIDQISVTLVLFMFKKIHMSENILIAFNHTFVAWSVLVLVILNIIICWSSWVDFHWFALIVCNYNCYKSICFKHGTAASAKCLNFYWIPFIIITSVSKLTWCLTWIYLLYIF